MDDLIYDIIQFGNADALAALIAAGADVNAHDIYGFTPLHIACCRGSINTVKALVVAGADVNAQNVNRRTPLHYACNGGHAQVVQLLLEAGADSAIRNNNGNFPQDITEDKEIRDLIENFELGGGYSLKAAIAHE
jgi:ankyrin repeat protein